jgi:hypothetical protein
MAVTCRGYIAASGHHFHQARVERRILAKAWLTAIGRRHFLRHLLARKFGNGAGRRNLHFLIDGRRPHIKRAPEDDRESPAHC